VRDESDTRAGVIGGEGRTANRGTAGARLQQPCQETQQGRLPGAIGPEQGKSLSGPECKVDSVDCTPSTKEAREPRRFE
jgi:hypothetical protein